MTSGEAINWLINITADIGKAEHRDLWHYEQALSEIREILESEPERKAGKWIHDGYDIPHGVDWMHCSVCGRREPYVPAAMTNYCPNCGADVRGERNDRK